MKTFACAGVAALVFAMGSVAFAAEKLVEIDASGGKSTGQWVLFLSKAMTESAPAGTAAVAVGTGDTFEGAFGMNIQGGKPVASAVKEELIKAERASDKAPAATSLLVKVTAEQHDAVKKIIDKWSAIEKHIDPTADVTVNFVQEVVDACGMKRAYRTGLEPVNAIRYYGDLAVVNRKLGQKAAG